MEERFYSCGTCGNLLFATIASGITPHCCGEEMILLQANQEEEGNADKHMPVVDEVGCCLLRITVGTQPHPMTEEHCIRFICVETTLGTIIRYLDCDDTPSVIIQCNGRPKAVYAYCNLHALWKYTIESCPTREKDNCRI